MGKPTGFVEYKSIVSSCRDPLARVKDWQEIQETFDEQLLKQQASRCMECGTPFCHTGSLINGKVSGCPLHNLMPEWNDLVYRGLWQEAFQRLNLTNNFPEFTGHVCPAPCEGACTAGLVSDPVTIKNIELQIIEQAFAQGFISPRPPQVRTGKKVAVIGSGPSGLACAAQLNQAGHSVTVFERSDRVGGILMYGIPNMKLDKKIVQRRIDLLQQEGVNFLTSMEVGSNCDALSILREFDATVLCIGSTKPRDLNVEGREYEGIHFAMDFLSHNTKSLLDSDHADKSYITAEGKDVIIIGGGDTGTDCVATSLRHNCRSVTQFEIMPCPPTTRSVDNPWPQYPNVYKQDYGQQECSAIFGCDPRQYQIATKKFVGDKYGQVKEIHTVQLEWVKTDNRWNCQEIAGTEKVWPAQLVILAMGFLGPEENLLQQLNIQQDPRSNISTSANSYATNIPGIFAAGDARRGQSLVVWAISEGRRAAKECDTYLMGRSDLP